jgi:CRISPR/Cas system-associated exonuclease Cas4 (RecB family)
MALQLSAYAEAYNEMYGTKIKTGLIVHVDKYHPHKLTVKEFKLGKRVFKKFLKLREMFDEIQEKTNAESNANL